MKNKLITMLLLTIFLVSCEDNRNLKHKKPPKPFTTKAVILTKRDYTSAEFSGDVLVVSFNYPYPITISYPNNKGIDIGDTIELKAIYFESSGTEDGYSPRYYYQALVGKRRCI